MVPEEEESPPETRKETIKPLATWMIVAGLVWGPLYGIVPKFKEVYTSLNQPLPGETIALLDLADLCTSIPGIMASAFFFALPMILFLRTEKKRPYRIFFYTAGCLVFPWLLFLIVALFLPFVGTISGMNMPPRSH